MASSKQCKTISTASVGFFLLVLGVIGITTLPALFRAILGLKLPLSQTSESFKLWKDIPLPIYFRAYMFNIENPNEILNEHAKPNLTEKGPYTFRLYWTKEDITWNPNDTISFREFSKYVFIRNMSSGDLSDKIISLNGPMAVAGAIVSKKPVWERVLFSFTMRMLGEKIFTEYTVEDLLFKGYYDYLNVIGRTIDKRIPDRHGYFSWFYGKNMSNDGLFNINTGKGDLTISNLINSWNGKTSLDFWSDSSCNALNGSNGELNPPYTQGQEILNLYRTDLCRSWPLTYHGDKEYFDIVSKHFVALPSVLANSTENPDNYCFESDGGEMPSGIIDISSCQFGAPVMLSQPHFFQADPIYRSNVTGMTPNETLHGFHIDIEPNSGIPLSIAARAQVNVKLRKVNSVSQYDNVPEVIFPVLWQEISGDITPELADLLKSQIERPHFIMEVAFIVLIGLGIAIAIIAGLWAIYIKSSLKKETVESISHKPNIIVPVFEKAEHKV